MASTVAEPKDELLDQSEDTEAGASKAPAPTPAVKPADIAPGEDEILKKMAAIHYARERERELAIMRSVLAVGDDSIVTRVARESEIDQMLQARALSLAAQVAVMYEPHFAGQIARKFARNISDVPDLPETTGKVFSQLLEDRDSNHLSGYVEKDVRHAVKLAGVFAPSAPAEEEELELIPFAMFNGLIRMRSRVISMLYAPHIQAEMLKLKDDLRGYIIQELKPGAKTRSSAKAK